jgi:hypothetical protein
VKEGSCRSGPYRPTIPPPNPGSGALPFSVRSECSSEVLATAGLAYLTYAGVVEHRGVLLERRVQVRTVIARSPSPTHTAWCSDAPGGDHDDGRHNLATAFSLSVMYNYSQIIIFIDCLRSLPKRPSRKLIGSAAGVRVWIGGGEPSAHNHTSDQHRYV